MSFTNAGTMPRDLRTARSLKRKRLIALAACRCIVPLRPHALSQVLASVLDDVFPIEGARRVVAEAKMYVQAMMICVTCIEDLVAMETAPAYRLSHSPPCLFLCTQCVRGARGRTRLGGGLLVAWDTAVRAESAVRVLYTGAGYGDGGRRSPARRQGPGYTDQRPDRDHDRPGVARR